MNDWLVYASAGFAGFLWGAGYVEPTVVVAFVVGLWLGAGGDVAKWAVIAMIVGYIVGYMIFAKKTQT